MAIEAPSISEGKPDVRADWLASHPAMAAAAVPAVAGLMAVGILVGRPAAGAVAAGAAFTTGFGAFKQIHGSAPLAMGLAAIGISASAFVGTLASNSAAAILAVALIWGFVAGLLPVLNADSGWIGQQCTIFLLIAAAFPGGVDAAGERAVLVLGGAVVQVACMAMTLRLFTHNPAGLPDYRSAIREARGVLASELQSLSPSAVRAVRIAVVLAAAVETWRWFELPNGYWLGMTALLLIRPNPTGTFWRAAERIAGTVVGAVAATALTHYALPDPNPRWALAALTGLFAGLALTLQQGNRLGEWQLTYPGSYAVFAACLTAYVVLLLDYGGLSPKGVAEERVLLTAGGGLFALVVHIPFEALWQRRDGEKVGGNDGLLSPQKK